MSNNRNIIIFVVTFLIVMGLAVAGYAHSFYPYECCHDRDCAPVLSSRNISSPDPTKLGATEFTIEVELTKDGQKYKQIMVGVTTPRTRLYDSPDGKTHACVYPNHTISCLFVPPGN